MRMMGGSAGILQPSRFKNVTFLYPNMYPYNRKGECTVEVWYKDVLNRTDSIKAVIPFNTYVRNGIIPTSMATFGEFDKLQTVCSSPDRDPLDDCKPVDCHKKYSGNKNFFSMVRDLCIPNPTCYSDPDKELPDVAYVPACNECRDVESPISEDDLRSLIKPAPRACSGREDCTTTPLGFKEYSNVRCHHGKFDNDSTMCECHAGWTSSPIPEDIYISSTLLLHFCTIRKPPSKVFNFDPILEAVNSVLTDNPLFVVVAAAIISFFIVLFVCCCISGREYRDYWCTDESDTDFTEDSSDSEDSQVINSIKNKGTTKLDGGAFFAKDDHFSNSPETFTANLSPETNTFSIHKLSTSDECITKRATLFLNNTIQKKREHHFDKARSCKVRKVEMWLKHSSYSFLRSKSRNYGAVGRFGTSNTSMRVAKNLQLSGNGRLKISHFGLQNRIIKQNNTRLKHYLKAFIDFFLLKDYSVLLDFISEKCILLRHSKNFIPALNFIIGGKVGPSYVHRHLAKNSYYKKSLSQCSNSGKESYEYSKCLSLGQPQMFVMIENERIDKKKVLDKTLETGKSQLEITPREQTFSNFQNMEVQEAHVNVENITQSTEKNTNELSQTLLDMSEIMDSQDNQRISSNNGMSGQTTSFKSTISLNSDCHYGIPKPFLIKRNVGSTYPNEEMDLSKTILENAYQNKSSLITQKINTSDYCFSKEVVSNSSYYPDEGIFLDKLSSFTEHFEHKLNNKKLLNLIFSDSVHNQASYANTICNSILWLDTIINSTSHQVPNLLPPSFDYSMSNGIRLSDSCLSMHGESLASPFLKPLFSLRNVAFLTPTHPEFEKMTMNSSLNIGYGVLDNYSKMELNTEEREQQQNEIYNSRLRNYRQSQKTLIPILKTSSRSMRKVIDTLTKDRNIEKTECASCYLPTSEADPDVIDLKPPKTNEVPFRKSINNPSDHSKEYDDNPRSRRKKSPLHPSQGSSFHNKNHNSCSVSKITHLSKIPKYEKLSKYFKAEGIEVTPDRLKREYKTIRSFERGILFIYNFFMNGAKGNKKNR